MKGEIAAHGHSASEIGKITIACQHVTLHYIEALFVFLILWCVHLPCYLGRKRRCGFFIDVSLAVEIVEAIFWIYVRQFSDVRLAAVIADDEEERVAGATQLVDFLYNILIHTV